MSPVFRSFLQGGFECARLEWHGNFCMIAGTGHLPERNMRAHYAIVRALGLRTVRDGLPPWLPIEPRLEIARECGMEVIWDLNHFWRHDDAEDYAHRVVAAVGLVCPEEPFWCCFNELSIHPRLVHGESFDYVRDQARRMIAVLREGLPDVRVVTSEPAHRPHEIEAHAGLADLADVIGINVYPHELRRSVGLSLRDAARRYGKPVLISETGLHKGHPRRWKGMNCKAEWLETVLAEVKRSKVDVAGVCLYPIVNTPSWHAPHRVRWDHGLIREDLSVDAGLAEAIRQAVARNSLPLFDDRFRAAS